MSTLKVISIEDLFINIAFHLSLCISLTQNSKRHYNTYWFSSLFLLPEWYKFSNDACIPSYMWNTEDTLEYTVSHLGLRRTGFSILVRRLSWTWKYSPLKYLYCHDTIYVLAFFLSVLIYVTTAFQSQSNVSNSSNHHLYHDGELLSFMWLGNQFNSPQRNVCISITWILNYF